MRNETLALLIAVCCFSAADGASVTGKAVSAESRVATQNSLFEEYYQCDTKRRCHIQTNLYK